MKLKGDTANGESQSVGVGGVRVTVVEGPVAAATELLVVDVGVVAGGELVAVKAPANILMAHNVDLHSDSKESIAIPPTSREGSAADLLEFLESQNPHDMVYVAVSVDTGLHRLGAELTNSSIKKRRGMGVESQSGSRCDALLLDDLGERGVSRVDQDKSISRLDDSDVGKGEDEGKPAA